MALRLHSSTSWVRIAATPRVSYRQTTQICRTLHTNNRSFQVSEEIQQAIAEQRPVVALESTIYTHGLPYPDNLSLASRLESLVRINGGVPATIGVLDGVARVGMSADELVRLVSAGGRPSTMKVSRRDLGFVCGLTDSNGKPMSGGTTVSATMILAHRAGIRVFATGGLGGVHRGAEQTMDISADLTELGKTPVAVISSGCKSFLDIPKTLEYLETQGVAVATFADGRDGKIDFPAFYSRESGVKTPFVVKDEGEAAKIIRAHHALGLKSGLHFANPIPEQHSIPYIQMEETIRQALEEAHDAGATGAASTPFILAKIKDLTGSKSVVANKALVEANVVRGTKVAVALRALEMDDRQQEHRRPNLEAQVVGPAASNYTTNGISTAMSTDTKKLTGSTKLSQAHDEDRIPNVFVAGSLAVDLACDYSPLSTQRSQTPEQQTSNPAVISQSLGGVGHNVARAAHLMGASVRLCSAVGDDLSGRAALAALTASGMSDAGVSSLPESSGTRTAQYVAINNTNRDLVLAMADMSILDHKRSDDAIATTFRDVWLPQIQKHRPSHLAIDANWPARHLARWLQAGKDADAYVTFEPVSNVKGAGLFNLSTSHTLSVFPSPAVHLATPNRTELSAIYQAARESGAFDRTDWWQVIDALGIPQSGARTQLALATSNDLVDQGIPQQSIQLLPFIPSICTKLGPHGVLLTQLIPANDQRLNSRDHAPYMLSRCANGTEESLGVGGVYMRLFPTVEEVKAEDVVSVNGVGDTFAGTLIAALAKRGKGAKVEDFVDLAQRAAVLTLKSKEAVSPGLGTLRLLL